MLAAGLGLILFVVLANLVVVQYGRGAIRSALEQGVRAGSVSGPTACEDIAYDVVADLLGGAMSDDMSIACDGAGAWIVATASVTFEAWTPFTPDFVVEMTSRATAEP